MSEFEDDPELIEDFVVESREALDAVDDSLLALESSPDDPALVNEIFRRVHSVKGASSFLGFDLVEGLSHAGESLLSKVRDGDIDFGEAIATALLEMVDALRTVLGRLESEGSEGPNEYGKLLSTLIELREQGGNEHAEPDAEGPPAAVSEQASLELPASAEEPGNVLASGESESASSPASRRQTAHDGADSNSGVHHLGPSDQARSPIGQILLEAGAIDQAILNSALALQQGGDSRRLGDVLTELGHIGRDELEAIIASYLEGGGVAHNPPTGNGGESKPTATPAESSIRVDIELLDGIVGLVGELVLTRNQIVQETEEGSGSLGRRTQELAYITSSLQEQALRTRMQRIENAWRSLPRVVRDISKMIGKSAKLEMTGESIELDRTIIEAIRDPLVHLVRNAVDHGLEDPKQRKAIGKPEVGAIRLSAIQEGGHVIIEVADDGGGIDPERIARSAIDKGLVTADEVADLSDSQKTNLILLAGFSTAENVTKISGRGVGMDVVASNLKEIRGSIEIASSPGVGTTIRLAIPLTLAIVPALVVTCADQLFAVPQASVLELVRLQGDSLEQRVEWVHSAPVLRLREQLLPLVELNDVLNISPHHERLAATIIVVQSGDQPFGLIVDQVTKAEEIVVKPVSRQIQSVGVYAGATVMGDGSAALILDVSAIARSSNLSVTAATDIDRFSTEEHDHLEPVLTVAVGDRQAGLPTAALERLEKVEVADVEGAGSAHVVQYRGRLLPLVFLSQVLNDNPIELGDQPLRVVVTSERAETSVGLVVDQVLDVVSIDMDDTDRIGSDGRHGVLGSNVAEGTVIDVLDVPALIGTVNSGPLTNPSQLSDNEQDNYVGSAA